MNEEKKFNVEDLKILISGNGNTGFGYIIESTDSFFKVKDLAIVVANPILDPQTREQKMEVALKPANNYSVLKINEATRQIKLNKNDWEFLIFNEENIMEYEMILKSYRSFIEVIENNANR